MADETLASIIALHQPKRAGIGAPRVRPSRPRKRRKAKTVASSIAESDTEPSSSDSLIPENFLSEVSAFDDAQVAVTPHVTPSSPASSSAVTRSGPSVASILLMAAAFALAAVGITTNGWFARSLGSSDIAGWMFLAIGVAADLVALVMPS